MTSDSKRVIHTGLNFLVLALLTVQLDYGRIINFLYMATYDIAFSE